MKVLTGLLGNKFVISILIAVTIFVVVGVILYLRKDGVEEDFYPLGPERIKMESIGAQRYNRFADTQDPLNPEGPIPFGEEGQKLIDGVLNTPTYEASSKKQARGPTMELRFDDPKMERPLPDNPELRRRIRVCEAVKTWDCNAFNSPEFLKYCGICVESTGFDSKNKGFAFGGLYLDPQMKAELEQDARLENKKPEYVPSVGTCPSEKFILTRPVCDYRKDRWECAHAQSVNDGYANEKCVQCQNPPTGKNTFVYVGTRNGKETNYALNRKPYYFTTKLRLGMVYENAKVVLTRSSNGERLYPRFLNTNHCEILIEKTTENEAFLLSVEYESYRPYMLRQYDNESINDMLQAGTSREDATRTVCEKEEGRLYTNGRNNDVVAYGCGKEICCEKFPANQNRRYAIVGQFESTINSRRTAPLELAIQRVNGMVVKPETGPPRYGSIRGSGIFKERVSEGLMGQIASSRFWVWDKDIVNTAKCEFSIVIPVSFLEATFPEDAGLCPVGPVVATNEGAERLQTGACDKRINGEAQGPGTYTRECLQQIYQEGGCEKMGKGYPMTQGQLNELSTRNGEPLDRDTITNNVEAVKRRADTAYRTGMDIAKMESDNLYCYGKFEFNPCDTPQKETGPQSPECLDFLFRNAGKTTTGVGPTYRQSSNRSSGTGRIPSKPVLYCQRTGKLSPMDTTGQPILASITKANSLGSVYNVKEYYDRIHKIANYSTNKDEQKRAIAECYGVNVPREKSFGCGSGGSVRYVRIYHGNRNYLQISQIVVLNDKNVNVAVDKPITVNASWGGTTPRSMVDGVLSMRPHPQAWHSADGNGEVLLDLQDDVAVSAVTIYNRADCCRDRATGIMIELLSRSKQVLATRQLIGSDVETVKFANNGGLVENSILEDDTVISLVPASTPGAFAVNLLGEFVIQANIKQEMVLATKFRVKELDQNQIQLITQSNAPAGGKVCVSGFRVAILNDDNSDEFKRRSSWNVVDSIAGNPGEISFASVSNPGFYLYVNSVARNIGINNDTSAKSAQTMSFAVA